MNHFILFILTTLPIPVWLFLKKREQFKFKLILAFSGAFLLGLMFSHTFPVLYQSTEHTVIALSVLGGFFLQLIVEHITKGIEHGHVHTHVKDTSTFPYLFFLALYFHAFTEALPLGEFNHEHHIEGFNTRNYALGLIVHKWPVMLALLALLGKVGFSVKKTVFAALLFSTALPLGGLLAPYLAWSNQSIYIFTGISVGILLHISTTILFEADEGHILKFKKVLLILAGFILPLFL